MLRNLRVSNLAVVESAAVDFVPGLNVLTGETGAGKSVLIGALELVLGGRADACAVREGAREARAEAEFVPGGAAARAVCDVLEEAGLPACEDGVLVLRRTVGPHGARAWANDSACSVATLKRLGAALVDIHGPRANQRILDGDFQREVLDSYAGLADAAGASAARVRTDYAAAWSRLQEIRAARAALEGDGDVSDEIDLLRYQTGELESARLTGDDDDLAARHAAAAHAGEILESAGEVTEALGGDGGVADRLIRLRSVLASLARRLPAAEAWCGETEELTVRVQELSRTVADAASALDADPAVLEELDARLSLVNRLQRKYAAGGTVADLLAALEGKRARLAELEGRGERLAELARGETQAAADVAAAGAALTKRRRAAAAKLGRAITRELRDLGFLKAEFAVSLAAAEPSRTGCDRVAFAFGPNPGEPSRPLAAIASSGEAARVMLAVKVVLAAHDATDVLVFDEIDANIGGETGSVVGAKLRAAAGSHQVIAITHLPQSAAFGARHLVVTKRVAGGRTAARVEAVSGEARVKEIARMLGGRPGDDVVRAHAEKLLGAARRDPDVGARRSQDEKER